MSVLVAVEDEIIVGTIGCREGHIRGTAVLEAWQGRGIAAQLLQAAEAELVAAGCRRITLDTTAVLEPAIRFYEKHGYRRSGRVTDFFGMRLIEYVKQLPM